MIRSLLLNIIYYVGTPLWSALMMPLLLASSRHPMQKAIHIWVRFMVWAMQNIAGIKLDIRGLEHAPRDRAFLLVSKHQSNGDPFVDYYLFPHVSALAKKELFSVPFIGPALKKLEIIRIDRASGRAHKGMDTIAEKVIAAKRPLIIFPEGTRVPVGEQRKLKSGAYYLQKDNDLPVVTVASNMGQFWPKGRFWRTPGTAIFEIHPAMPKGLTKKAFMTELEKRIVHRSNEIMVAAFRENPRLPDPKAIIPTIEEFSVDARK